MIKIIKKLSAKLNKPGIIKVFCGVCVILFLASVAVNIHLIRKDSKVKQIVIKPQLKIEDALLKAPVNANKLMRLPQDEKPQVFKITGQTPRNQEFIKEAKNGDVLLLYIKNQKAVLYDPMKNQILKVGPLIYSTASGEIKK